MSSQKLHRLNSVCPICCLTDCLLYTCVDADYIIYVNTTLKANQLGLMRPTLSSQILARSEKQAQRLIHRYSY
jgi:hypothetical protein